MHFVTKCLLLIAIIAALIFIIKKTIKIYFLRKKYNHLPGPPATGLLGFYLGNLDQALRTINDNKILSDLMNKWVKQYGPVFKFQILDKVVVFTIDPEGVKEAFITQNFPKIPEVYENVGFPYNERYLGNGLITDTDMKRWKHRRSLFNPGFHRHCLMSYLNEVNSKGDILLERLRGLADGKTVVKLFDEVNHATLDIIASIAFGMNVDSINNPTNELNKNVYESLKGFYRTTFDPLIYYKPNEWNFIRKYKIVLRKLRKLARNQIINRIAVLKDGGYVSNDILTNLLKSHENEGFDVEDMTDDFLTFFVAGQETTANTLAFSFLEIGRHPEVLEKIRNELNEVLGSRSDITSEDLTKLQYTNLVYRETLRLWPPIPEIARLVKQNIKIQNYDIPQDSWLQVSSYVSGRQEEYFEDPLEFKPERFSNLNNENPTKNYTYFPFSMGPRNCIGQNFAQMVGKVFIAKVIKNFDITLDPSQNFGIIQEATLRPCGGTRCFLLPRKN